MFHISRKMLFLLFLCLSVAVAAVAEDQSDGFVPATGNETQTSAPVVTTPSSGAPSNGDAASAAAPSSSAAVDAAVSDLSSVLDSFFKALKTFFDALSQLFSSIFGGSANASEVSSPETSQASTAQPSNADQTTQTPTSPAPQTASPTTSGQAASQTPSGQQSDQDGVTISAAGRDQMKRLVEYARKNHRGASNSFCFNAVWGYLTSSGYGKLRNRSDLPNMKSDWARHFSDYLNGAKSRLDEAGLQRLDTTLNPPITNPHDSRIPDGAVIVVAPGSYGTSDPDAGDITVKAGDKFINDGPDMDYGTKSTWYGKILGVYVPQ